MTERFSADPAGDTQGEMSTQFVDPQLMANPGAGYADTDTQVMPGTLTDYLDSNEGSRWVQSMGAPDGLALRSDPATYEARRDYVVDWGHGPLAPEFRAHTGRYMCCEACIAGSTLSLSPDQADGSETNHEGTLLNPVATQNLTLSYDGDEVAASPWLGATVDDTSASSATYDLALDTDESGIADISQSTGTHTELTFTTPAQADPDSALPAGTPVTARRPPRPARCC